MPKGHPGSVNSVAFSPDGKLLASGGGGFEELVKLWNVARGQEVFNLSAGDTSTSPSPNFDSVNTVAFSPDGKLLASGSFEETVKLWDVASGQLVRSLMGRHTLDVRSVAFSPDGKLLALGAGDGTVNLSEVNLP